MTASIKASADGLSAIIQVGGADKVTIGPNGIEAGALAPQSVTPNNLSQKLTLGTAVASTSGTAIDFTGIPSWARRVTVMFSGVSTNGASPLRAQIGSGSVDNTGYNGGGLIVAGVSPAAVNYANTAGFELESGTGDRTAASTRYGSIVLTLVSGTTWVACSRLGETGTAIYDLYDGTKTLSGPLDRIRVTTVSGTDTFDAGSINILYEG